MIETTTPNDQKARSPKRKKPQQIADELRTLIVTGELNDGNSAYPVPRCGAHVTVVGKVLLASKARPLSTYWINSESSRGASQRDQRGSPRPRCAMMFRCTSLVPA